MKFVLRFLLIVTLGAIASADTLRLRDGRIFQGQFLGASKTEVWFERQPQADTPSTVVVPLASVDILIFDPLTRPSVTANSIEENNKRMWNKEQSAAPASSAAAPKPVTSSYGNTNGTLIGESMRIKGSISSQEPLLVNGEIEGQIESGDKLTVGPSGKAVAGIKAREAMIAGTVEGNMDVTERIVLMKGANLTGDVKTAGIVIEDGAYFKGGIDIMRSGAQAAGAGQVR